MRKTWIVGLVLLSLCSTGLAQAQTRCFQSELEAYRPAPNDLTPEQLIRTHTGDHPMTPPDNPDVGDSWLWYIWHLSGYPWAELTSCTVRGEGTNVYVVVEDSQWGTNVNQADIDAIVDAWDNTSVGIHPDWGIYDLDTTYLGPAPDALDNDPKIYVLYYDFDVGSDGFFWFFDQYPDGTYEFESNECEVLYMNSSDYDPGGEYLISVQAHEFAHMIHWLADEDEVSWVNEGFAELAMWLFGHPDDIYAFPANPDNDLTAWNGNFADYVKVYLWTLYFFEQFDMDATATLTVMAEAANSTAGYDNALADLGSPRNFSDMVADWVCANFLDDPSLDDGQYGYLTEDLPTFNSIMKNSYPVPPTNGSINRYAADYVRFIDGQPQRLWFDGTDYATWRPRVMMRNAGVAQSVHTIDLDGVDYGTFDLFDFGETTDEVILAVVKFTPGGVTSYQYGTEEIPAAVGDPLVSRPFALLPGMPNPLVSQGTVQLQVNREQNVTVRVIDPAGRQVRELSHGIQAEGTHALVWDGTDDSGRRLPAGVYFVRAEGEDGTSVSRWVRVE